MKLISISSTLVVLTLTYVTAKHAVYNIGYLGVSNNTNTANKIRQLLMNQDNINNNDISMVIQYRITNTCEVGDAIHNLFDLLHNHNNLLALVVYSCTEVLKVIAEFSKYINLTVLGLGSTSAVLKNHEKYPTLQLLSEVENTHSLARVKFVLSEGWDKVATLSEDYEDYTLAADSFYKTSLNSSVTVERSIALIHTPSDIIKSIGEIKKSDLRIIFVFGSKNLIESVLLSMASTNFFRTKRVIISNQDISTVPENTELFYIGSVTNQGVKSSSKYEYQHLIASVLNQMHSFFATHRQARPFTRQEFTNGFVYDSDFTTSIYQYNHLTGSYNLLANFSDYMLFKYSDITWLGGCKPVDGKKTVIEYNSIDEVVLYVFVSLSLIGSLLALCFLIVSCKYKHIGLIKLSSPILNCVNIIGAFCLYSAVCVMGLDHPRLSKANLQVSCVLRNFLLCIGYSLAFGPMCSKAYRVHYIIMSTKHGRRSSKRLKDRNLLLFTVALVLLDILYIISWQLIDPLTIKEARNLEPSKSDIDTHVYKLSYTCTSGYMAKWVGTVYAYKGALVILGVYLAWSTRHISIPTLNDSKSIMLNIYIVVVASVLVVTTSTFLKHDATLTYCIVGSLILISTTIMTSILFIPKMLSLWKLPHEQSNRKVCAVVMHGTGLISTGSNIRRLEVNPNEQIRELETQDRVLRSEIEQLNCEVSILEKMSLKTRLTITDFLTEDLLYILPIPLMQTHDDRVIRLTRRHTPKYKILRQKQKDLLTLLKGKQDSSGDMKSFTDTIEEESSEVVTINETSSTSQIKEADEDECQLSTLSEVTHI